MKAKGWGKVLPTTTLFLLGALSQAFGHDPVTLKDINGNPISETLKNSDTVTIGNATYVAGNPVSWEVTCGSCHNHQDITGDLSNGLHSPGPIHGTYHIGRGWDEMSDDFGYKRVKAGKDWRKFLRSFGDDGAW